MWTNKRCRRLEAVLDDAGNALLRALDENVELTKRLYRAEEKLERAIEDNKRLSADRDDAILKMEEAFAQYRELRDHVETLAHRVEEQLDEMLGAVHGL